MAKCQIRLKKGVNLLLSQVDFFYFPMTQNLPAMPPRYSYISHSIPLLMKPQKVRFLTIMSSRH